MKMEKRLSRKEHMEILDEMIKNIENLPSHAMSNPVTHYDLLSLMLLLQSVFRSDCNDPS